MTGPEDHVGTLHDALGTEPANQPLRKVEDPIDYGYEAQKAAEKHLDACDQAMWCEQGECEVEGHGGDGGPFCDSPAFGPYCGCQTCIVREVLCVAWPIIEQAVRA